MIAIKGIPQAILLYGGIQYRSPRDIDLLVSPESMEKAHQALCNSGYVPQSRYFGFSFIRSIGKRVVNEAKYKHEKNLGVYVDLHFRLHFYRSVLSLGFETVLASSQNLNIGGRNVRTLSHELAVIFLLSHGALHAWHRLFWLCDAAQIPRGLSALNWVSLMDKASKLGVARRVASGLVLANRLLGSPLPEEVSMFVERDPMVGKLVHYVMVHLGAPCSNENLSAHFRELFYLSKLGSSPRYKAEVAFTSPVTTGLIATCWDRLINFRQRAHRNSEPE
jgi:hypothetical protein